MERRSRQVRSVLASALVAAAACTAPGTPGPGRDGAAAAEQVAGARELDRIAADARGFPALRDLEGRTMADGQYAQWPEGDRLHVQVRYDFVDGREAEERAVLSTAGGLAQEEWSWRETRDGRPFRRFEVDLRAGTATAARWTDGEVERWSEEIDAVPGRAFVGFGVTFAIRAHRERLVAGESVELQVVGFTPAPRVVGIEITHAGREELPMAGLLVPGDRFDVEPQVPWFAELFVDAPTTRIWLTRPPAGFLRYEGPLVEVDDPTVRIDLLPGEGSGPPRKP